MIFGHEGRLLINTRSVAYLSTTRLEYGNTYVAHAFGEIRKTLPLAVASRLDVGEIDAVPNEGFRDG